jgi:hypothetical protein
MLDNYEVLPNGVIKQKIVNKINYNYDYSNNYNNHGEKGKYLNYLRFGVLTGVLGRLPKGIVDIGYGNGDFLKVCKNAIDNVYGCDISDYPVPEGCIKINFNDINTIDNIDVICFFDSLEHFDDINIIKDLKSEYIFISVPWCHYISDKWFDDWCHRKSDEHLFHFNKDALINFFKECNYTNIYIGCFEDAIRQNNQVKPLDNILSGIFKKNSSI